MTYCSSDCPITSPRWNVSTTHWLRRSGTKMVSAIPSASTAYHMENALVCMHMPAPIRHERLLSPRSLAYAYGFLTPSLQDAGRGAGSRDGMLYRTGSGPGTAGEPLAVAAGPCGGMAPLPQDDLDAPDRCAS